MEFTTRVSRPRFRPGWPQYATDMSDLAVVNCRQLVTLAGPVRPRLRAELRDLAVIPDGTMLIRDGRIAAVGSRIEIPPDAEIVDAGGRIVLPGFVDAHTHAVFAGT